MMTKIWYLAHPVKATIGNPGFDQNMRHSLLCARALWDLNYHIIMPWHTCCQFLDDKNVTHRFDGMLLGAIVLRECEGIILTGHELSQGMATELDIARAAGRKELNLIGVEPIFYPFKLGEYKDDPSAMPRVSLDEIAASRSGIGL